MTYRNSRLKGFFKLERGERIDQLRSFGDIPVDQTRILGQDGALPFELADLFVENAIGSFPLPLGVATSFKVNGADYVLPMAVEESSVIAAASNAAKWVYESGGFSSECVSSLMIGQIQLLDLSPEQLETLAATLAPHRDSLISLANDTHPRLLMRGGGARAIETRIFPDAEVPFGVVHVHLDTKDAMGANLVNTVCERLAPEIEKITGARIGLRILSNLADQRLFTVRCEVLPKYLAVHEPHLDMSGPDVARRIFEAFVFADNDPYRAATHNKGIMNGIDPVVIATGNDWRAIEAGAHAYAAHTGRYRSLSRWTVAPSGNLCGELTLPLQLGTVGGVTRLHPLSRLSLQLLGNPESEQLGKIIACAGLASNLAALRALVTTGIQRGHMKLHAKNLALAAGAKGKEVEFVANAMVLNGNVSASQAEKILSRARNEIGKGDGDGSDTDSDDGSAKPLHGR